MSPFLKYFALAFVGTFCSMLSAYFVFRRALTRARPGEPGFVEYVLIRAAVALSFFLLGFVAGSCWRI